MLAKQDGGMAGWLSRRESRESLRLHACFLIYASCFVAVTVFVFCNLVLLLFLLWTWASIGTVSMLIPFEVVMAGGPGADQL